MPAYKNNKDNTWYAKFSYKNWMGETKFTCKRGFATKREAVQYEHEFKETSAGNTDMTFQSFVEIYRQERYPRIRTSTASNKDYVIEDKILPYFKNKRVVDIKASDVLKWQNELLSTKNPKTGQPYSKTYLKTVHNQMSAIMSFAVKYYDLKENPVIKAGSIGLNHTEEMDFWTLEEYQKFSEAMMEYPLYYYCFEVLYWTGMRVGEMLALSFEDFDLEAGTVSISKTYQVIRGQELIGPPKTSRGYRTISIPTKLCDELKDYYNMCYDKSSSRMFPVAKNCLHRHMIKGCVKSGVKRIRIHDLRHSHVSLLINQGFSVVDIAKRVGHEGIDITLRYAHMFPNAQDKMSNSLDNLMKEDSEDVSEE